MRTQIHIRILKSLISPTPIFFLHFLYVSIFQFNLPIQIYSRFSFHFSILILYHIFAAEKFQPAWIKKNHLISYTHPFGSYPPVHSSGMSFKIWNEAHEWTAKKRKSEKRWNIKRKWKLFYSFIQLKIVLWNKIHEPKSRGKEEVATHKKNIEFNASIEAVEIRVSWGNLKNMMPRLL